MHFFPLSQQPPDNCSSPPPIFTRHILVSLHITHFPPLVLIFFQLQYFPLSFSLHDRLWLSSEIQLRKQTGSTVQIIMKCLRKGYQVKWWASPQQYKCSSLPKEESMECISPQSKIRSRCHSQLAYWEGCCGPQEPTVRGLTQQLKLLGDAWRFNLLTPACLFCTARLRGALQAVGK